MGKLSSFGIINYDHLAKVIVAKALLKNKKQIFHDHLYNKFMIPSPQNPTKLEPNQIFVFDSNLAGAHGAGTALTALSFGALIGVAEGPSGQTYAIPTTDLTFQDLPIQKIAPSVEKFQIYAQKNFNNTFIVTEIGCGLGRRTPHQMAYLFAECVFLPNVLLPESFLEALDNKKEF